MKTYPAVVVGLVLGWLPASMGYLDRAAAERALSFAAYVQEEVFDSDKWTIATGCKPRAGTSGRPGLRGQTGRCTFGDFCEHIWKAQNPGDTIPKNVDWGKTDKSIADPKMNPEDMVKKIMTQLKEVDAKGKKTKLKKPGFTGKADALKIIPGMTSSGDGLKDYYKAMETCGDRSLACKAEFDRISGGTTLSDEAKTLFGKWMGNAKDSAELLYDLRHQDKWNAMWDPAKGNMASKMTVDPVKTAHSSRFKYVMNKGVWYSMDVSKTIDKFPGFQYLDKVRQFFDKWSVITSSDNFKNHDVALKTSEKIKVQLAGC